MSGDLLLELEMASPVAGNLENIEDLLRVLIRDLGMAMQGMRGVARSFANVWQRIILEVARGQTTEMQAVRPRLLSAFEGRLAQATQAHALATVLRKLGREDLPDPDILLPEIAGLERLKTTVFDHWQTPEDLERLAVENYPLSQAQLEQVAAMHPPPPEWYAGEEEQLIQE